MPDALLMPMLDWPPDAPLPALGAEIDQRVFGRCVVQTIRVATPRDGRPPARSVRVQFYPPVEVGR